METIVCERFDEFNAQAANWCRTKIQTENAKTVFVPAGNTPVGLYKLWTIEKPDYLVGISLLQIDEVLTGEKRGLFQRFFTTHLPAHQQQLEYIEESGTTDVSADIGILGLGLNGHVAFHEPGIPDAFFSGCVRLSGVTCANLKLEPETWGITYGLGAFLQCKSLLIMVEGQSKSEVLKRLLARDESLPATQLLNHPRLTLLTTTETIGHSSTPVL